MSYREYILIALIFLYLVIHFTDIKNRKCDKAKKILAVLFAVLFIPLSISNVASYHLETTIDILNKTIDRMKITNNKMLYTVIDSNQKVTSQGIALNKFRIENKKMREDQKVFNDEIRTIFLEKVEYKCIEDMEERKENIKKLHDHTFKISKAEYDSFVDDLFKDVDILKQNQKKLELEQIKQSDQALIYFESLLMYVLQIYDSISEDLEKKGELLEVDKYEGDLSEYIYAKKGHYLTIRKYALTKDTDVTITIANRYFEDGKLKRYPLIKIDAKDRPFTRPEMHRLFFHIKGPKVKDLMPKNSGTTVKYTLLRHITYPIDRDPLSDQMLKKQINALTKEMFKRIYLKED